MTIYDLFLLQIIAHLLADFSFQSNLWVRHKQRYAFRSKTLYWHSIIVFLSSFLLSNNLGFIFSSAGIAITHFFIDGFKNKISNKKYVFFFDQFFHIVIIIVFVMIYNSYVLDPIVNIQFKTHYLLILAGYLFCTTPSNVLIKKILELFNIKMPDGSDKELENAGKLIGIMERILILTFLFYKQFEAIGFLLAAKSVLRYEGSKSTRTEYVLVGTMLSFGIVFIVFTIINQIKF